MRSFDLGLIAYEEALAIQEEALEAVRAGGEERMFLLEHPPVITFGRNGGEENLPYPRAFFTEQGVAVAKSTRGGNITCHFPGQLVVYPIMRIQKRSGGLRQFFYDMEEVVIRMLSAFSVQAARSEGRPGVWVGARKICSTGIAVSRWISYHGLAINIARDLALFDKVTPCGLAGVEATSLERECNATVAMQDAKNIFLQEFSAVFQIEFI